LYYYYVLCQPQIVKAKKTQHKIRYGLVLDGSGAARTHSTNKQFVRNGKRKIVPRDYTKKYVNLKEENNNKEQL